jgi:hypothetical protein
MIAFSLEWAVRGISIRTFGDTSRMVDYYRPIFCISFLKEPNDVANRISIIADQDSPA